MQQIRHDQGTLKKVIVNILENYVLELRPLKQTYITIKKGGHKTTTPTTKINPLQLQTISDKAYEKLINIMNISYI